MATNPNFQEFLQDGDYLKEDWQRVYDLRFCTILVPLPPHLANRAAITAVEEDSGMSDERDGHGSNEAHDQGQDQPPPETMIEKATANPQISPPASELNSPPTSPLQAESRPSQTIPRKPITTRRCLRSRNKGIQPSSSQLPPQLTSCSSPEIDQSWETSENQLHQSHELAKNDEYMTTREATVELSQPASSTDTAEQDFEDEVDQCHDVQSAGKSPHLMFGSKSTPAKRKHWELDMSRGLLHPCQPDSPPKRVALSSPTSPGGIITVGRTPSSLLKPRFYEPSVKWPSSYMSQSSFGGATSSSSDDNLFKSTVPLSLHESWSDCHAWTSADWRGLKKVYLEMNGDAQSDAGLGLIADRFLVEDAARNGGQYKWERPRILTRCVALQMVGKERQRQAPGHPVQLPLTPYTPLLSPLQAHPTRQQVRTSLSPAGIHRSGRITTQPYSAYLLQADQTAKSVNTQAHSGITMAIIGVNESDGGTTSTRARQLVTQSRTGRNNRVKKQYPNQGYQLKSIFKARFAESMDNVRQLLGFWKEVEQGNSETREEVLVPIVPLHRVQSAVEAFESGSMVLSTSSECEGPTEESVSTPATSTSSWSVDSAPAGSSESSAEP